MRAKANACICWYRGNRGRGDRQIVSDGRGMSEDKTRCPQCGSENDSGDHFCSNCGSRLLKTKPVPAPDPEPVPDAGAAENPVQSALPKPVPPSQPFPPAVTPSFIGNPPVLPAANEPDGEWKMSSLGPPPKPKRRLWLWIVIGILAACLVVCVAAAIFLNTGTGQSWLNDIGTQVSNEATKQAN
jgi:hypothetical protein